jgi:hypothetical protein
MTLACVMLGTSGLVRAWQDDHFATAQSRVENPPFPLKDLPKTLGEWRFQDGSETSLDPQIARVAGCTDHLIRVYTNATTGVSVTALILFGPAQNVFGHRPEVCYPAAGYRPVDEAFVRRIATGSGPAAEFRSQVYSRRKEQRFWREEVHYSFRHGNQWSPDPERSWKEFRHQPSMFKVQIQRPVIELERREVNNPTEEFLAQLLPALERRIAHAAGGKEDSARE